MLFESEGFDARIAQGREPLGRAIARRVVNHDEFPTRKRLGDDAGDSFAQQR